jgi:outer membrane protein assembly factor BamA
VAQGQNLKIPLEEEDTIPHPKNFIKTLFSKGFIVTPVLFYTPETEFGGGLVGFYSFRLSKDSLQRPSSIRAALVATSRGQFIFDVPFLISLNQNKYVLDGLVNVREYPYEFYGVGNEISLDTFESFAYTTINLELDVLRRLGKGIFLGPRFNYENYRVPKIEEGGLLENTPVFGREGGLIFGVGGSFLMDRRENLFFPQQGYYLEVNSIYYDRAFGGDFNFYDLEIDARKYFSFKEDMVLALQGYTRNVFDDAPFLRLAQLGGKRMMRGYFEGAYQSERYLAFQSEFRWMFYKNFGFVAFGGIGGVSEQWKNLTKNPRFSYGGGLRYRFNKKEKISVRFDYGFGKNTDNFYFTVGEAF